MSIINWHVTLASEPQGITGVYATSCHWATLTRLHVSGLVHVQVPDSTRESEGMPAITKGAGAGAFLTVVRAVGGVDVRVDADPQPATRRLTSRTPIREAVQALRRIRRSFIAGG